MQPSAPTGTYRSYTIRTSHSYLIELQCPDITNFQVCDLRPDSNNLANHFVTAESWIVWIEFAPIDRKGVYVGSADATVKDFDYKRVAI